MILMMTFIFEAHKRSGRRAQQGQRADGLTGRGSWLTLALSEGGRHLQQIQHLPGPLGLRCDKCSAPAFDQIRYVDYFVGDGYVCRHCSRPLDLLRMFSSALCNEVWPRESYYLVGGHSSIFTVRLVPGEVLHLRFAEHGVPEDALILQVNYTPTEGGLFPIEMHGNQRQVERFLSSTVTLYPAPLYLRAGETAKETVVNVLVTWIEPQRADHAVSNLFDAFYYFHQGHLEKLVIPANVAVEDPLNNLCNRWLADEVGKKTAKDFLENAATYSYQLNVLLRLFAKAHALPPLKDELRGALNRLRMLRNKLAHEGKLPVVLAKEEAAELVAASLVSHVYLRWATSAVVPTEAR